MKLNSQNTHSLAAWIVLHPIGVSMLALSCLVLGVFSLQKLGVDLLPHIIYPEVRVRVLDQGVPAQVMEDRITRQLEEQLAITEDVISIQSRSSEGRSAVDLSFPYGTDIDTALRDASIRLDRAKRFLPTSIDPPVIYKRDPSQRAVLELVVSSALQDVVDLRNWADYELSKWFVNLEGVAAVEVGGGMVREIHIVPDIQRLQAVGLRIDDVIQLLKTENQDSPTGQLRMQNQQTNTRLVGRFADSTALASLAFKQVDGVRLGDVAQILDSHADEKLRIRLNGQTGIKLSIQKQPQANTVEVVDAVHARLHWLATQHILPDDIKISVVGDQAIYVRHALRNAAYAVLSGAILAMLVVWVFLGDWRRTLIIGTAIPLALMVTFSLMAWANLSLNIMTLGGLAVGVGLLVDSAIVMLENITRHQRLAQTSDTPAIDATVEMFSPIIAATSTNLAAIVPFLLMSGVLGLLFRELIFTIAAATFAAMLVALTLVPTLAARLPVPKTIKPQKTFFLPIYLSILRHVLRVPWLWALLFCVALAASIPVFLDSKHSFLPRMTSGQVSLYVSAEVGITLADMDQSVADIEALLQQDSAVDSVFSSIGGFVFGRSQFNASHRSSLTIQLKPEYRDNSTQWIKKFKHKLKLLQQIGIKVRLRSRGIRGIRLNRGDDDISLRIRGDDLNILSDLANQFVAELQNIDGLSNVGHSMEDMRQTLQIKVDKERAQMLGLSEATIAAAVRTSLQGQIVTYLHAGDRQINVRLRVSRTILNSPHALGNLLLPTKQGQIRLNEVAQLRWQTVTANIKRDQQQRMVEISAAIKKGHALSDVLREIEQHVSRIDLPTGYVSYDGGLKKTLQAGQHQSQLLLGLALFLVFVVMAVQYESLRNPLVILLSVPFALVGVAIALYSLKLPLSMPVWLGLIMLTGLVVNNAIVLIEAIELQRAKGIQKLAAILSAAQLRLRPILMTTLTTVVGLLPLALAWGEGATMLQPLAISIVFGLSFSLLVSLFLLPAVYMLLGKGENTKVY